VAKKVSRYISAGILVLMLIALLLALRAPNVTLVPISSQDVKSFDEKISSLLAAQQGGAKTAHITEAELTSKLQQGLDAAPPSGGAVVLKAASIQLVGDNFVGVFTLDVSGKEIYLTVMGTLNVQDGRLQIEPSAAKLGSLPLPAMVFRRILQRQFDTPESRERLRLPAFIKDVRIDNGELLVESP
jgi:CobQ-like glutamine amidotransferase family enzyme